MDLSVWQALYEELKDKDFIVIAVAMESRGIDSARPWIEQGGATYPCLVDVEHHVADLYNMVNVPQAVWIDEEGRIVRPTEVAGASDAFRVMDRTNFTLPDDAASALARARQAYVEAIKDWVEKGSDSRFAFSRDEAKARVKLPDEETALANANFRLGQYLRRNGKVDEGDRFLAEAVRLRPDSWNFFRQSKDLEEVGKSGGPEFWARVDALGDDYYYEPPDIEGMPGR